MQSTVFILKFHLKTTIQTNNTINSHRPDTWILVKILEKGLEVSFTAIHKLFSEHWTKASKVTSNCYQTYIFRTWSIVVWLHSRFFFYNKASTPYKDILKGWQSRWIEHTLDGTSRNFPPETSPYCVSGKLTGST